MNGAMVLFNCTMHQVVQILAKRPISWYIFVYRYVYFQVLRTVDYGISSFTLFTAISAVKPEDLTVQLHAA